MPRDLFAEQKRATPPPRDLFVNPGRQEYLQKLQAPGVAPSTAPSPSSNPFTPIAHAIEQAGLGYGQALLNIPHGLAGLGTDIAGMLGHPMRNPIPPLDFAPHTLPAEVGSLGAFLTGPGWVKGLAEGGKALEGVPILSQAGKIAHAALTRGGMPATVARNALLGSAFMPEHPGVGAVAGAINPLVGKALMGAARALPTVARAVRPSTFFLRPEQIFKSHLSPEELAENLRLTAGTRTPLHEVLGLKGLQRAYENVISRVPFSGASSAEHETAAHIINKGHDILDKLAGDSDLENFDEELKQALINSHKEQQNLKRSLYDAVNKQADQENFTVDTPNFSKMANKLKNALESTKLLQFEDGAPSLMKRLNRYENFGLNDNLGTRIVDAQGNEFPAYIEQSQPSLLEANLLKAKLNNMGNRFSRSPEFTPREMAPKFKSLGDALDKDIKENLASKGSPTLNKMFNTAQKNYAENYVPYLDKDIYKYLDKDSDANTLLSSFVKTGKYSDRVNLLNKLMTKLPPDKQNLLGYTYLTRALDEGGVLNPLKVRTLLSKNVLGQRQLKALFPNEQLRQELLDYTNLAGKNTKALKGMENPQTGQIVMDYLPLVTAPGEMPAAGRLAALAAKSIGARKAVDYLTSEASRTALVNKMIENSLRDIPRG